jgi:hypothetical protein
VRAAARVQQPAVAAAPAAVPVLQPAVPAWERESELRPARAEVMSA